VDALAGVISRPHRDLDLIIDEEGWAAAAAVLSGLGYSEWYRTDSDRPTFSRVVVHDHPVAGRVVDVHPIDVAAGHLEFATGSIEGHPIPCLSVESQMKTHSNYRKRWRDRADLGTLHRVLEGSATALVIPVPAAEGLCEESAHEEGMPAHITLLHPFLRSRRIGQKTERELESVLANVPAFDFTLSEVRSFPKVIYLAPEPAAPFVKLVESVVARWPEHQPYGGAFDEIVPHVTIAYRDDAPEGLAERLPVGARADEVWLMSRVGHHWVVRRRFKLSAQSELAVSSREPGGEFLGAHGSEDEEGEPQPTDRRAEHP
jgi:2'-5' RNA ligase